MCREQNIEFNEQKILDIDAEKLRLVRALAIKELNTVLLRESDAHLHLIGVHLTFRWKSRLIPGFTVTEMMSLKPDGFLNVIDNVEDIFNSISINPKWQNASRPDIEEIQYWLMEEEFITKILGEITNSPVYLVSRKHNIENISQLFLSNRKKLYLSYPITAIKDDNPEILTRIQGEILDKIEEDFIVFNPLAIEDMKLTYPQKSNESDEYPELLEQLNSDAIEIIKSRTVHRDFQLIDQSDGVIVFYLTDKVSAGVLGEMNYAQNNQKKVFVVFEGKRSPFLTQISYVIKNNLEDILIELKKFASE